MVLQDGIKRNIRKYRIHIIIWTCYMFYESVLVGMLFGNYANPTIFISHYLITIIFFYIHSNLVLPLSLGGRKNFVLFLPFLILLELFAVIVSHYFVTFYLLYFDIGQKSSTLEFDKIFILRNLYRGTLFIGFATGYYFIRTYLQERKYSELVEQEKLLAVIKHQNVVQELSNARNSLLRAQINPHFLFNTLNFVYLNVKNYSPTGGEVIARLSDMMRFAIGAGDVGNTTTLAEEIEQVENLIFINKIIKSEYIPIDFKYPKEYLDLKIIPLVLMTLLENIFKHGNLLDKNSEFARFHIEIKDGKFTIKTFNKVYETSTCRNTGMGLQNLDDRLRFTYGKNVDFSYGLVGCYFKVSLILPLNLLFDASDLTNAYSNIDTI